MSGFDEVFGAGRSARSDRAPLLADWLAQQRAAGRVVRVNESADGSRLSLLAYMLDDTLARVNVEADLLLTGADVHRVRAMVERGELRHVHARG